MASLVTNDDSSARLDVSRAYDGSALGAMEADASCQVVRISENRAMPLSQVPAVGVATAAKIYRRQQETHQHDTVTQ